MTQVMQPRECHIMDMKEVVEGFSRQVLGAKTRMGKDLEISGVVQNVGIHVLPWNVSP